MGAPESIEIDVEALEALCGTTPLAGMPYVQAKRLALGAFNRSYLKGMLAKTNGNVTAAANLAGLDRSNFRRLLKQYQVLPKRNPPAQAASAP